MLLLELYLDDNSVNKTKMELKAGHIVLTATASSHE